MGSRIEAGLTIEGSVRGEGERCVGDVLADIDPRLGLPPLTEERRKDLVKVAHKYAEAAKVAVRHVRRDGLDVLKKLEKDHMISEDDGKRSSEQIQKATDDAITELDRMLAAKNRLSRRTLTQPAP